MHSLKKYCIALLVLLASNTVRAQDENCSAYIDSFGFGGFPGICTPPESTGSAKRTDHNLYMGFVWSFDGKTSKFPDLLIGYRAIEVKSNDRVSGGDLNFRIDLQKSFSLQGVRLSYVGGKRELLGNIGFGYSLAESSLLATGALQTAYLRVGGDYFLGQNKLVPYIELNSLRPIKRVQTASACPPGTSLETVAGSADDISDAIDKSEELRGLYLVGGSAGDKTCFLNMD